MTSIWGPLGWMTLHSASSCFPDSPLPAETALMQTWLDMFQATITCPSCKEHFGIALNGYRRLYPQMVSSRREFMLAVFRIHNTVNRRLNKPIYATVADCFEQLRTNVKTRTAKEYRIAYINHIRRHWRTLQDASGFAALKKINEMNKIETSYFQAHENNFEVDIPEDNVLPLGHALDPQGAETPSPIRVDTRTAPRLGLLNGRFQVRR
uniref:thiol oxidase n=1 Tax=viral metagenome TaxID=1070528 RepID=A0A6C0F1W6_9ZZZZ